VGNADVWYCNSPVGRDMLAKFMCKPSVSCGLSQSYAIHFIRATNLNECSNFADVQIMSVTGHKSESSLAIYQRTSDQKKIQKGTILNSAMTEENNTNNALPSCRHYPALPAPSASHSQIMSRTSQSQSQRQLEFQNQMTGINLNDIMGDFDNMPQLPVFQLLYRFHKYHN
jgi:hypothetical protein